MGVFGFNHQSIARKLFLQILLLSLTAAFVLGALQLYLRYRDQRSGMEQELQRIEVSHLKSIATHEWLTDELLLRTELEGILSLPHIQFIAVHRVNNQGLALGVPGTGNFIVRDYPLVFSHHGREIELGKLVIHADLNWIRNELLSEAATLSLVEAGKIFAVAFLVFILFQLTVGKHLRSLALQASAMDAGRPFSPFNLDRSPREEKSADELEYIFSSLNRLYTHLQRTIENLRETNERLDQQIGERKRAEEALREKTEELDRFFTTALDLFCVADTDGCFRRLNPQWEAVLGYSLAELEGRNFLDLIHPEDLEGTVQAVSRLDAQQPVLNFVNRYRCKDGSYRWIEWRSSPRGKLIYAAARDITDRKLAEQAMRESETRFRQVVEASPIPIGISNLSGRIEYINPRFVETFGYALEEVAEVDLWFQRAYPDPVYRQTVVTQWRQAIEKAALAHRPSEPLDIHITCRDGSERIMQIFGSLMGDRLVVMGTDLTERIRSEEALRSSLAEKESLLKEVHHRVKNNLQVISSLLHLQGRKAQNPEVHAFLRDTQNRVRSMALLHETLYRSGNLAKVGFPRYVKSICAHLARSYASGSERIRLRDDIADLALDMDQAIPAGLIISELVSNAFQHAFPSGSDGEILVEFQAAGEHHRVLRVSDNGVGLPAKTHPQTAETLGLLLVSTLSRQLDGLVTVTREQGAVFEIVFPADSNRSIHLKGEPNEAGPNPDC
ncbi:MAG: PAS domain S-box protein [Pseudomonadota bacterium]